MASVEGIVVGFGYPARWNRTPGIDATVERMLEKRCGKDISHIRNEPGYRTMLRTISRIDSGNDPRNDASMNARIKAGSRIEWIVTINSRDRPDR